MNKERMIELATGIACRRRDRREFLLGAVGIRSDGAIVMSRNEASAVPQPDAHAEARLARKLDHGATVFVARVLGSSGELAMAKPCHSCEMRLRSRGVKKVFYTDHEGTIQSMEFD